MRMTVLAVLMIGALVSQAFADEIPEGLWNGTMIPPEGREVGIGIKVSSVAGRTLMTMSVPGMGVVPLSKPLLDDGLLTFDFKMGETSVSCELDATPEGGFAGPCFDGDGKEGSITIEPINRE